MTTSQHDSEALQQYRKKAAEIAELRKELDQKIGSLEPSEAQKEFDHFVVRTKEFEQLRAQLEPKELFMAKYGVIVINDHTVSFVIPQGCSRLEMLQEAQAFDPAPQVGNGLIQSLLLKLWAQDERFTTTAASSERICIDGNVQHGVKKSREQQIELLSSKGLQLATFEDLAVAFALHWTASGTGEPLFLWQRDLKTSSCVIRAAGGDLHYVELAIVIPGIEFRLGLTTAKVDDSEADASVGIAARIPQNLTA